MPSFSVVITKPLPFQSRISAHIHSVKTKNRECTKNHTCPRKPARCASAPSAGARNGQKTGAIFAIAANAAAAPGACGHDHRGLVQTGFAQPATHRLAQFPNAGNADGGSQLSLFD